MLPDQSVPNAECLFAPALMDNKDNTKDQVQVELSVLPSSESPAISNATEYRLYRRRFVGIVGMFFLNLAGGISWPWFGPIANNAAIDFGFSLDQINWLGNVMALVYLPVSLAIPGMVSRFGLRRCLEIGSVCLIVASWIRYAGTAHSLSSGGSFALILIGQIVAGVAQPIFQVLSPIFSETWFGLKGRTTATMIVSIANPVGGALGQLISPIAGDARQSVLILGIICTVIALLVFLVQSAPPTPPTYAASQKSSSLLSLMLVVIGQAKGDQQLSRRERGDFLIIVLVFGTFVASINTFSILTGQIMQPVGYSADTSGFMGACLLLTGLAGAILTAPLFDRVFTYHLALTAKIFIPIIAVTDLGLVWGVKPNNEAGLFVIMALIGFFSVAMLPVGLELACDLTQNAEASSSLLWFCGNLLCFIFVLAQNALREGPDASPPLNMRRALIFNASFVLAVGSLVFFLRGKQVRKELDEQMKTTQRPVTGV